MRIYVKSRNKWEDYGWLPAQPPEEVQSRYDAAPGEKARTVQLSRKTCAVVLPEIPTTRVDLHRRQIVDRLVVEGLTKGEALHLIMLYQQDLQRFTDLVEPHLKDNEDKTQTLTSGLEEEIQGLLGAAVPAGTPSATKTAPRPATERHGFQGWGIAATVLKLALLLTILCLFLSAYAGNS